MKTTIYWHGEDIEELEDVTGIVLDGSVFVIEIGDQSEEIKERRFIPRELIKQIIQTLADA